MKTAEENGYKINLTEDYRKEVVAIRDEIASQYSFSHSKETVRDMQNIAELAFMRAMLFKQA